MDLFPNPTHAESSAPPPRTPSHPKPRRIKRIALIVLGAFAALCLVVSIIILHSRPEPRLARAAVEPKTENVYMTPSLQGFGRIKEPPLEPPQPPPAPPVTPPPAPAPQREPVARSTGPREPSEAEQAAREAKKSNILFTMQRQAPQAPVAIPREAMPPAAEEPGADRPARVNTQQQFMERNSQLGATALQDRLQRPESPWMIMAGTLIPAVLVFGINSELPGYLKAQVREPVMDSLKHQTVLIPQGSTLIGRYDEEIVYGQSRVLCVWTRIILPNGNSLRLEGMPGIDMSGYAGIKGKVNNHFWSLARAVLMSSIL
jgi:type IV secretion system protein TrbI